MQHKQIKVYRAKPTDDPTPYEMARREGKSTWEFLKMTGTLLVVFPAFVYVMSNVLDPFMHHPLTGVIAFGGLVYATKLLVEALDAKY